MSSNIEDALAGRVRYYGVQFGTVVDNKDPRKLHRVRVNIPGICEPASDWLFPLTIGGGSPQRGGHVAPAVGADVAAWFHQGDPNGRGAYACAHWGVPAAGTEMPDDVKDAGDAAEQVHSLEFPDADGGGSLRVTVDERRGHRAFHVLDVDKAGAVQCAIVLDREKRAIALQAVSLISIQCDGAIVIDALEVNILGRRVAGSPAQIG